MNQNDHLGKNKRRKKEFGNTLKICVSDGGRPVRETGLASRSDGGRGLVEPQAQMEGQAVKRCVSM